MKTLKKKELISLYENSNQAGQKLLSEKYGADFFNDKGWIQLFDDFCKEHKLNKLDIIPFTSPKDTKQQSINAFAMLSEIVPIENKGWIPDWNNSNEYKYFPYFDMRSGFGFSHADCGYWNASTNAGSRLCSKSSLECERIAKKYLPIYEKLIK